MRAARSRRLSRDGVITGIIRGMTSRNLLGKLLPSPLPRISQGRMTGNTSIIG